MTIQEFDNTRFGGNMKIKYRNQEYLLGSVDFEERLIGYISQEDLDKGDEPYAWARCENCELLNEEQSVQEGDASKADSSTSDGSKKYNPDPNIFTTEERGFNTDKFEL